MSPSFLLVLFPVAFVALWCGVSVLIAFVGGWSRLAREFRATDKPAGNAFYLQGGSVGMTQYKGCLVIYTSAAGLYLSVLLPFRLGHPPLLIPWGAIRDPEVRKVWWFESLTFRVGEPPGTTIQLSKRIFAGLENMVRLPVPSASLPPPLPQP